MRMLAWTAAAAIAVAGCGTPPNQTLLTRTSTYMKAMSYGNGTGFPLDVAELERRFPELKGIGGTAPYEYRIPYGANLTIEVTGETVLTRTYTVPPTGYVHYPYLTKLKVAGLTVDELKDHLQRELAVYLKKPEVLIHINTTPYQPTA